MSYENMKCHMSYEIPGGIHVGITYEIPSEMSFGISYLITGALSSGISDNILIEISL